MSSTLRRSDAVSRTDNHGLFVGEILGRAVALLHVFERPAMDKPPEAVVQALVVDTSCRGNGVGRQLMQYAERWALRRGLRSICLGSRADRDDAHGFYGRLGYQRIAVSHVFRKHVGVWT